MPPPREDDEERPLLRPDGDVDSASQCSHDEPRQIQFGEDDEENPKAWNGRKKLINVGIISLMAILSPLASSMFTPGITQIAEDLDTNEQSVIATTTGFVITLGLGPLVWAPLSEDFGRRALYIACFAVFTVLQAASALSPNIQTLIAMRTVSGFFGSVGIANGGGTISDMYDPSERAGTFGWYLLGPLLGPTLGPLFGGVIVSRLGWRWIYWFLTIVCAINTAIGYFFLKETYAPVLLGRRKAELAQEESQGLGKKTRYYFDGEDERPLSKKLLASMKRPFVIFVQPIVLIMSMYQALIFGTTYSIYTNMQSIYSEPPYNFNSEQIGLLYLGPGLGFLTSVRFLVPRIDTVFNRLTEKHGGKALPEYRLPLANVGSVLIPVSLFWFAWTVQFRVHWLASIAATYFYGVGQVVVFNTVQNYYIDSFSTYAASAIAGGSVFRSLVGGGVPLVAPLLFEKLGYGWGISCFGFLAVLIAPSPLLFYYFGGRVRERFQITF
ncbi:uncharacterized protein Z520_04662 [Fonsecaea multimorphosa CBS 102226]|uniref:Major facilitator superfamily (MFS) profile domain-containing protein n=1 Tax=Fonsecaea multimorphosa CBS 102226 TaxID=1442371 RepID=A0A0D2KTE5_9EURO|nr:uncharacterized protein Z520_04662 [Fonsecaea multimorphosa CBS 102226]KIY00024.1 hypothetical protein Z520_04662 [Fonsecaea multimorphosa CBS 102226]OAL26235.1 hypothetical protein AYO22_04413 [Fonsecaea multimorphosa]